MWNWIISYFWPKNTETQLSLEDAFDVLTTSSEIEKPDKVVVPEPLEDCGNYFCSYKRGVITKIDKSLVTIDGKYQVDSELSGLSVGMKVSFIAYTNNGVVSVTNLAIVDNDWDCSEEGDTTWCSRVLLTKIIKRDGRILITSPGDIKIDLNTATTEFIPIVGDWLELDVKCVIDENVTDLFGTILEINKLRPLRPQVIEGKIKIWNALTGVGQINNNIYFNQDSLSTAYCPVVGDEIVTEVIESEQGRCIWRALKVLPKFGNRSNVLNFEPDTPETPVFKETEEVYITEDIFVKAFNFRDQVPFTITITNKSGAAILLKNIDIKSKNIVININDPRNPNNVEINHMESLKVQILCKAKTVNLSSEAIYFEFKNFSVRRVVNLQLEMYTNSRPNQRRAGYRQDSFRDYDSKSGNQIIRGERTGYKARFISNRLGEFKVPEKLIDILWLPKMTNQERVTINERLFTLKPCLSQTLSFQNYADIFHTLLYIEEIHLLVSLQSYDQERACFIRNGEFLMLEVENLAERRPSLVVGDKIIVSNPGNTGKTLYEGIINKVSSKHLYLKFNRTFHDSYNGEDYAITAESSRTSFRRMHQAIGLALQNLGMDILFPSKIITKPVQVKFIYDKYDDVLAKTHEKIKDRSIQQGESDSEKKESPNRSRGESKRLSHKALAELIRRRTGTFNETKASSDTANAAELTSGTDNVAERTDNVAKRTDNVAEQTDYVAEHTYNVPEHTDNSPKNTSANGDVPKNTSANGDVPKITSKLLLSAQPKNQMDNLINRTKNELKLEWFDKSLNYFQKEAVRNVLLGESRPLPYIIFGPPGTGKTVTIIEIILQITRMLPHSRLLIGAPSNSAADIIALRLIDSGALKPGDLVRLVSYRTVLEDKIPVKLVPYCATANVSVVGTNGHEPTLMENGMALGCNSEVIGRHRITIGTCGALGNLYNMGFPKDHFTHFIIDEAGQTTEPEVMVPLSLANTASSQIVLAGDPMQLNPVVISQANDLGLSESYLERLTNRFPYIKDIEGFPNSGGYDPRILTKLIYNYRSLPEVLTVPNELFYHSELRPTISETNSEEADLLLKLKEILPERERKRPPAMVFHGVEGEDFQTEDSPSWFNPDEACQVFYYLNELYRLGVPSTDIGIISPYAKQVKQIRSILVEAEFDLPRIGTIEDFQGQEFKIIIISTVRTKAAMVTKDRQYSVGFVGHPKRLNVALTRAQALTIVIGSPFLLITDKYWQSVLKYCVAIKSYCGCNFNISNYY